MQRLPLIVESNKQFNVSKVVNNPFHPYDSSSHDLQQSLAKTSLKRKNCKTPITFSKFHKSKEIENLDLD